MTRRVLVALDKFKGTLDAERACEVVAEVIRRERPHWQIDCAPLTDGGDGFCRITTRAAGGVLIPARVHGPLFDAEGRAERVEAAVGVVEASALSAQALALLDVPEGVRRLAVIDMASASGLSLVPRDRMDVWRSSSRGTGELLLAAAGQGVDAIVLGVGGSATSDLGLGALETLGLVFHGVSGTSVSPPLPALWPSVTAVSGRVRPVPSVRVACDVDNPLFGPRGAAAVYGPQKGLRAPDLPRFEAAAERLAREVCRHLGADPRHFDTPGAGAAGGIAFGLLVGAGARLVPGSALVAAWLGLEARARAADWVLTGEGRFDESSWAGKGPGALVALARAAGRRCAVFAGSVAPGLSARGAPGPSEGAPAPELIAISPPREPLSRVLPHTRENLEQAVARWLERTLD